MTERMCRHEISWRDFGPCICLISLSLAHPFLCYLHIFHCFPNTYQSSDFRLFWRVQQPDGVSFLLSRNIFAFLCASKMNYSNILHFCSSETEAREQEHRLTHCQQCGHHVAQEHLVLGDTFDWLQGCKPPNWEGLQWFDGACRSPECSWPARLMVNLKYANYSSRYDNVDSRTTSMGEISKHRLQFVVCWVPLSRHPMLHSVVSEQRAANRSVYEEPYPHFASIPLQY